DLREQSAFLDETTAWYFSADEADDLAGALVALPIRAGQPVPRDTLIAGAAAADRFGALLADFPGHSLFPLPLDQPNVIAPPAAAFLPGDVVGITVVIEHRPQPPASPTPDTFAFTLPGVVDEIPPVLPTVLPPADPEEAERGFPPLAKDLFPGGVRVITVQGLPEPPDPDDPAPAFSGFESPRMLILLVPDVDRELLSLAIQQGDRIFISLLGHADTAVTTAGFTYWDFEAWFREDRTEP
ncbi:MAG TPA: hypothetical protein VMN57_04900, partial [Anaerolineales bacterium]|nr:hypothetical protein [Anaerolineales bacterium]